MPHLIIRMTILDNRKRSEAEDSFGRGRKNRVTVRRREIEYAQECNYYRLENNSRSRSGKCD